VSAAYHAALAAARTATPVSSPQHVCLLHHSLTKPLHSSAQHVALADVHRYRDFRCKFVADSSPHQHRQSARSTSLPQQPSGQGRSRAIHLHQEARSSTFPLSSHSCNTQSRRHRASRPSSSPLHRPALGSRLQAPQQSAFAAPLAAKPLWRRFCCNSRSERSSSASARTLVVTPTQPA
jgi:hypothetical protein